MSMMNEIEPSEFEEVKDTKVKSLSKLPEQSDLFFKVQMIFFIQFAIIAILI
jgi:hypothetical protein